MSETQARLRHRERVEALAAASIRALSGDAALSFRGHRLHRAGQPLPLYAPHLQPGTDDTTATLRGAADGLALRLLLSDAGLHRELAPAEPVERLLFDWLEQFRVEAAAPARWPGVAANLRQRHEHWSLAWCAAGHADSARGLLLYTLAQVARARVAGESVVEATEDLIEPTRFFLAPRIGHALARLRALRHDQRAYAVEALAIAATLARLLRDASPPGPDDETAADDELRSVIGLLLEEERDAAASERFAAEVRGAPRLAGTEASGYRVFRADWDAEVEAASLVRREALAASRARLDRRIAEQRARPERLAAALRALLGEARPAGFIGAQEEGTIDGRSLARLVATPGERAVFRQERVAPAMDAAVAFLIDCSGSMKAHAEDVAVLVDVFCRALERAGAASEVLGFTTGAWHGGRAQKAWLRAGRPARPGRLNERLHVVFKAFETTWRRGRAGIAALLHGEHFREGLDGEALAWAATRLLARPARRRLLVVVSDGSPTDGATALANGPDYLERHLHEVAGAIERGGAIELHALGVGLDLGAWYASSHLLDLDARIGNAMFAEVLALLGRRRRPS